MTGPADATTDNRLGEPGGTDDPFLAAVDAVLHRFYNPNDPDWQALRRLRDSKGEPG